MRASLSLPLVLSVACATGGGAAQQWDGPPVQTSNMVGGDVKIVMTVPTGGFALVIDEVVRSGGVADVKLQLREPTGDLVTQVVTELPVVVPAKDLGDAAQVRVWVGGGGGESRLAGSIERG